MEVQRGSVLSEALPLLVLPCPAAVVEVRQLERSDAGARLVARVHTYEMFKTVAVCFSQPAASDD